MQCNAHEGHELLSAMLGATCTVPAASCAEYDAQLSRAPGYVALLNTTFALVPAGRQPASFRLNEVLAAAAIPVLVSDGRQYVPPFDGVVQWEKIAFHFAFDTPLEAIVASLSRVSATQLTKMQQGVRLVWQHHLRPGASATTFYELLHARACGIAPPITPQMGDTDDWQLERRTGQDLS